MCIIGKNWQFFRWSTQIQQIIVFFSLCISFLLTVKDCSFHISKHLAQELFLVSPGGGMQSPSAILICYCETTAYTFHVAYLATILLRTILLWESNWSAQYYSHKGSALSFVFVRVNKEQLQRDHGITAVSLPVNTKHEPTASTNVQSFGCMSISCWAI